jgi:hypothetical protein
LRYKREIDELRKEEEKLDWKEAKRQKERYDIEYTDRKDKQAVDESKVGLDPAC